MVNTTIGYPAGVALPQAKTERMPRETNRRSKMQSGRSRVRAVDTRATEIVSYDFKMKQQEMATFETWYVNTLKEGTLWFNMIQHTPTDGRTLVTCRFVEPYNDIFFIGEDYWGFSARLEVYRRPILDSTLTLAEFPDYFLASDIIDVIANVTWPSA